MSGTHGQLYSEIGELVVAANAGEALDLEATSEELSQRYANLNVPPEVMARAIARSLGAVGVSMALLNRAQSRVSDRGFGELGSRELNHKAPESDRPRESDDSRSPSLFPSGVRLALLS